MNAMKRSLVFSAILLLGASTLFAEGGSPPRASNRLLNEVIQMTDAGLSDDTIVAYVRARRARLAADVTADDLIRLRQAGVHEAVVRYIAEASGTEAPPMTSKEMSSEPSGETQAVEPADGEDVAVDYGSPYAYGYPYWYGWLGYPYWYGYGPYFSSTFFIGGRSFHGGRFGHRGFGHGGGHRGFGGGHGGRGRH